MVTKIHSNKLGSFDLYFDAEDIDIICAYKWVPKKDSKNGRIYAYTSLSGKTGAFIHRLIMQDSIRNGLVVDHQNGVGLDNRRCNLRVCTKSQNAMNRLIGQKGYKGITMDKGFRVRIMIMGKMVHGGRFKTLPEAIKKYNELSIQHHKEFSSLNPVNSIAPY